MKRFLRYFLYREVYRWIRNAGKDDDSSSSQPLDPDEPANAQPPQPHTETLPIEDGTIETVDELKTVLQQMDPYDFEHFVAELWNRMGWETEVSSAAMDEGVDVTARKQHPYEQTTLIQAKRYGPNTTVGSPDIQQYASLSQQYDGIDKVIVVTTNEFTAQARDLAGRLNVKLIDGDDLAALITQYDALDLVDEYLDFVTAVESEATNEHHQDQADPTDEAQTEEPRNTSPAAPDPETTTQSGSAPTTIWEKIIMGAIPGWIVAFFGIEVLPEPVWAVVFFTVWLGLPVALFLDARHVRQYGDWPQYWWAYVLTSLIWLFAIIPAGVYLWRRRSTSESADAETDTHAPDTATADTAATDMTTPDSETGTQSASSPDAAATPGEHASHSTRRSESVSTAERADGWMDIEYEGERYHAQIALSPNGEYTAAYHDGRSGRGESTSQPGRVFLFDDDDLRFTTELDRPNACAVANNGTVAVVDWNDWGDTLSGTFHVFNESGHRFVKHEFDANIGPTAITPDGEYAATSTFNPDCSTHLFDVDTGETLLRHENQHGNVQHLEFADRNGNWMIRLGTPAGDSAYGIDFGGHVVWKSDGLKRQDRLEELLESSEETDLHQALLLLEEALDLASEDYEERNVVQQLADTHWKLAKTIKQDEGATDDWWEHLDQAAQYYRQTLPRYAGKQGLAKVKRQQGKQLLNDGKETAARDCFEEIASLEEEYDVQLLTDADKRRLNKLQ